MSLYYAEGFSLETDTQVGRRLQGIRERETYFDPLWQYAPPRPPQPPRQPESVVWTIVYALAVLAAGPFVVWATLWLYGWLV